MGNSGFSRSSLRWALPLIRRALLMLALIAGFWSSSPQIIANAGAEPSVSKIDTGTEFTRVGTLGAECSPVSGYRSEGPVRAAGETSSDSAGFADHQDDAGASAIELLMTFWPMVLLAALVSAAGMTLWIVRARSVGESAREACRFLIPAALISLPLPIWLVARDLIEASNAFFRGLGMALGLPAILYALVVIVVSIAVRVITPAPVEKMRLHLGNVAAFFLFLPIEYLLTLRLFLLFAGGLRAVG